MSDFITFLSKSENLSMGTLLIIGIFTLLAVFIWWLPEIYRAYKEHKQDK